MKRCNIVMNDASYINVAADRMSVIEEMLYVWNGESLVAVVEIDAVISAHISEKGEQYGK